MWKSRTLWLAGFALLSLGSVGCVIDETDDSAFQLSWGLEYVGGGAAQCDLAGTPTVRLQARHLRNGNIQTQTFDCGRGAAVTPVLPVGPYEVTVSLLDRQSRPVSAIQGEFDVRRHGLTGLGHVVFKVQIFEFSWILVQQMAGGASRPLSCAQAGATSVELITQLASEAPEMFAFPCEQGEGVTEAVRLGSYAFWGRLINRAGQVIDETGVGAAAVGGQERPALGAEFIVP